MLYVTTNQSARRWTNIKARLDFCRVSQDGDDEGALVLDRLPTAAEGEAIREALGLRKRRHLSEDAQAQARSALERAKVALNRPQTAAAFAKSAGATYPLSTVASAI